LTFQQIAGEIKNNNNNTEALLRNCEPNLVAGVKRPLARPTHLNLSLQDIFSQSEDINLIASKSNPTNGVIPSTEKLAALLSTPEGPLLPPETSSGEDLKIHELLSFPAAATESSHQTSSQRTSLQTSSQPGLISPKNGELLMPASVTIITLLLTFKNLQT